jgi:hypothetical protein
VESSSPGGIPPRKWTLRPGDAGFNAYAVELLRAAGLPPDMSCAADPAALKRDRLYQRVLAWLVHPHTPIRRLLVAWQLGMGKTIGMLRVLDNYFETSWPKLILFPNVELVDNFYREFMTTPNRYMHHYQQLHPDERWPASPAAQAAFLLRVRQFMERWPKNVGRSVGTGLSAPLRAFTFAEAAGSAILNNPVLRWPDASHPDYVERSGATCFRRTVLLLDEAHNLLPPPPAARGRRSGGTNAADGMAVLRARVIEAHESVVVLFTATPVVRAPPDDPDVDVRHMMELVKGAEHRHRGDEGFVSWVMDRPPGMYANVYNLQRQTGLPHVTTVSLEDTVLWDEYLNRRFGVPLPTFHRLDRFHPNKSVARWRSAEVGGGGVPASVMTAAYGTGAKKTKKPIPSALKKNSNAKKQKKKKSVTIQSPPAARTPTKRKNSNDTAGRQGAGQPHRWWDEILDTVDDADTTDADTTDVDDPPVDDARPCLGRPAAAAGGRRDCWPGVANIETTVYSTPARELEAVREIRLTWRDARDVAPKLAAIVESIREAPLKTVILIHRANGLITLVRLLRLAGIQPFVLGGEHPVERATTNTDNTTEEATGKKKKRSASAEARADTTTTIMLFNEQQQQHPAAGGGGNRAVVLVAAAEEFSEGVSFMNVRRIVLADLSGGTELPSAALVHQRIGRALRACSHQALPVHMRTLTVDLYVATHRDPDRMKTLDEEKYEYVAAEAGRLAEAMERLAQRSVDRTFYAAAAPGPMATDSTTKPRKKRLWPF